MLLLVLQTKKTFSEQSMFIGTREHTFPPYGPDGQRIVPRRRQTMTGCQTVHRTRKHNQSVLLPIPSHPLRHLTARTVASTRGPPVPPQPPARPRHLSARLARDEVHVAFLSPLLSSFASLHSARPVTSFPFNNYQNGSRSRSRLAPRFPVPQGEGACCRCCCLPFARLLLFFTRRTAAWRFGSAWCPAASRAACGARIGADLEVHEEAPPDG
jgi:hypothetical protein